MGTSNFDTLEQKLQAVRDASAASKAREKIIAQQNKDQKKLDDQTIQTLNDTVTALRAGSLTPDQQTQLAGELDTLATEIATPWDTVVPPPVVLPTV